MTRKQGKLGPSERALQDRGRLAIKFSSCFGAHSAFELRGVSARHPVIIAFQHALRNRSSPKTRGRLKAMGAIMDDVSAWIQPTRCAFGAALIGKPGVVYIGAGSREHKLGKSVWARHVVSQPGLSRFQSLELFEAKTRADCELLKQPPLLEGARLMCHAGTTQRSHADSLIKLFGQLRSTLAAVERRGPPTD